MALRTASHAVACLLALAASGSQANSTTAAPDVTTTPVMGAVTTPAPIATTPGMVALTTAGPSGLPIKVNVQGQSGKFTVYPESKGVQSGIQIEMDALREVDTNGGAVGTQGSDKHSIQTFASQTFTISPMVMVQLDGGVSAAQVSFQSTVSTVGKIGVDTYVMAGSGTVGPQGETWAVRPGDLKWNVRIWDWQFCDGSGAGACRANDVGDYIELDVSVKGLASASKTGNKTIDLGGQATLELSNQVFVDNSTWSTMPSGYPAVHVQGGTTTITFRFPKFNSSILYDPVIGTSALIDAGAGSGGSSTTASSMFVLRASLPLCLAVLIQVMLFG